jgi:hypothetical protein
MKAQRITAASIVKSLVCAAALLAAVTAVHTEAHASGCAPGDPTCVPSCLVPGTQALGASTQGTISAVITNFDSVNGDVDATARLQWQGKERVYRRHLTTVPIVSAEDLICQLLAAGLVDDDTGLTLGDVVGAPPKGLKLNGRSVTGLNFNAVPGGPNSSGIAEVTIYVVKP